MRFLAPFKTLNIVTFLPSMNPFQRDISSKHFHPLLDSPTVGRRDRITVTILSLCKIRP